MDGPGGDGRARLLDLVRERGYRRSAEPLLLSSGGTSYDYVDLRRAFARGEDLRLAAEVVAASVAAARGASPGFDAIGGMTMGADPVAHAVALLTSTEWFSVRKGEKAHGSRRRVEGAELGPGVRTVVFEDTVSTGRSLLEALDVVASTGAEVVLACSILDRGRLAAARFAELRVPYLALLDYGDLGIEAIDPGDGGIGTSAGRGGPDRDGGSAGLGPPGN